MFVLCYTRQKAKAGRKKELVPLDLASLRARPGPEYLPKIRLESREAAGAGPPPRRGGRRRVVLGLGTLVGPPGGSCRQPRNAIGGPGARMRRVL